MLFRNCFILNFVESIDNKCSYYLHIESLCLAGIKCPESLHLNVGCQHMSHVYERPNGLKLDYRGIISKSRAKFCSTFNVQPFHSCLVYYLLLSPPTLHIVALYVSSANAFQPNILFQLRLMSVVCQWETMKKRKL